MIAIGLFLVLFGLVSQQIAPVHAWRIDRRDFFATLPFGVGMLLIALGWLVLLWRYLP